MCPSFLDSGLRRNDGYFCSLPDFKHSAVSVTNAPVSHSRPHRHSGESRNPVVYIIHSGLLEAGQNDHSSFCFKGKGTDRPDLPDTTQPITSSRLAPECVLLSWIPACAGMTGIFVHCQTLNTLPSPSRTPRQSFLPPSSLRLACYRQAKAELFRFLCQNEKSDKIINFLFSLPTV